MICSRTLLLAFSLLAFAVCLPINAANAQSNPAEYAIVRGTVSIAGNLPARSKVAVSTDPECRSAGGDSEELVVNDGRLANALVYIKEARTADVLSPKQRQPASSPALITLDNCRFHPHVVAVTVGQPVKIVNRGSAPQQIRSVSMPAAGPQLSFAVPASGKSNIKTFTRPELMLPLVSESARMYLNVFRHTYFAVTGSDGKFQISGLPPGRYTLSVVHEKLGEEARQIEVGPKQEKIVDFVFNAASIH